MISENTRFSFHCYSDPYYAGSCQRLCMASGMQTSVHRVLLFLTHCVTDDEPDPPTGGGASWTPFLSSGMAKG